MRWYCELNLKLRLEVNYTGMFTEQRGSGTLRYAAWTMNSMEETIIIKDVVITRRRNT